ncbi:hypothetical protein D3C81_1784310 [compost metagenome]
MHLDIRAHHPVGAPLFIKQRFSPTQEPPVFPVFTEQAVFALENFLFPCLQCRDLLLNFRGIVGVDHLFQPLGANRVLLTIPKQLKPPWRVVPAISFQIQLPNAAVRGFSDQPIAFLTSSQPLLVFQQLIVVLL